MSLRVLNSRRQQAPALIDRWRWEYVNHFGGYKRKIVPAVEKLIADYREKKHDQFRIKPFAVLPDAALKPVFPKGSFLASWKSFEEATDETRQIVAALFHEEKNALMEEAHDLREKYGVSKLALKSLLRLANLRAWSQALSSADYDNFDRDLALLKENPGTFRQETLHIGPNPPRRSGPEQIKSDENKSLRNWAFDYLLSEALLERNAPAPEKRQAHLHAVWRRTAQLQENNGIAAERFPEELQKIAIVDSPQLSRFKQGIERAKQDLAPTFEEQKASRVGSLIYFQTVRGPGYTLDIDETAPDIAVYLGNPDQIPLAEEKHR